MGDFQTMLGPRWCSISCSILPSASYHSREISLMQSSAQIPETPSSLKDICAIREQGYWRQRVKVYLPSMLPTQMNLIFMTSSSLLMMSPHDIHPEQTQKLSTLGSQVDVIVTAGLVMAVAQSEQDSLTRSRVVEIDPNVQDSLSPSKVVAIDLSGPDSQSPSLHFQLVPRKLKRAVDVKRDYDFHLSGSWNVLGMFDILMPARFSLFVQ